MQDLLCAIKILDAVLFRLTAEFPEAKSISIRSDNSYCYQNDLLMLVETFIAKLHRFDLKLVIHRAPQYGKNNADLHYAIGMIHIQRYVNEIYTSLRP